MGLWQEPSSFPPLSLLHLFLLTCLLPASFAQTVGSSGWTVVPSNKSADLSWTGRVRYQLDSAQVRIPPGTSLAPLTNSLAHSDNRTLESFHISGPLVPVDASTSRSLRRNSIAFITCDESAYKGNLGASETVANAITSLHRLTAVILYSTDAHHCNYTVDHGADHEYANVFTLVNPLAAEIIRRQLRSPADGITSITGDMSYAMTGSSTQSDDSGPSGGDSPNTAMIILYSITGIITALFLAIIITGAVRAHRHPERYGPRYTAGRPRQSRARGIARAMVETIPIVKFGDAYDPKVEAVKGDVEMAPEGGTHTPTGESEMATGGAGAPTPPPPPPQQPNKTSGATSTGPTEGPTEELTEKTTPNADDNTSPPPQQTAAATTEQNNFSCPICTDDFVKGQDLRVLPCNHQFHPDCVDPWLLNVSGTCPLCRIDLNPNRAEDATEPAATEGAATEGAAAEGTDPPQEGSAAGGGAEAAHLRSHRRLTSYLHGTLNARRMRDATVEERLAALRSVRENNRQTQTPDATSDEPDERSRRRSGLTTRLRDRFRIRTQAHGDGEV
ncbi:RING-H2 finger protein [Aspergillus candidus]|uniref:RING-type domain-containing protein n=1 Tax=Aspergillus candidus TaxID=41067 RepID=A0A2I2FFN2_ASPCN|nr:hypothetical protein BDW47DRAFT_124423 [Aspergillus candidus]PLB39421.1 hypothetical protein BDW47DRAFT_124423 [Aspergillus candidus]